MSRFAETAGGGPNSAGGAESRVCPGRGGVQIGGGSVNCGVCRGIRRPLPRLTVIDAALDGDIDRSVLVPAVVLGEFLLGEGRVLGRVEFLDVAGRSRDGGVCGLDCEVGCFRLEGVHSRVLLLELGRGRGREGELEVPEEERREDLLDRRVGGGEGEFPRLRT